MRVKEDYAKLLAAKRLTPKSRDGFPCLDLILDLAPRQRIMALSEPKVWQTLYQRDRDRHIYRTIKWRKPCHASFDENVLLLSSFHPAWLFENVNENQPAGFSILPVIKFSRIPANLSPFVFTFDQFFTEQRCVRRLFGLQMGWQFSNGHIIEDKWEWKK